MHFKVKFAALAGLAMLSAPAAAQVPACLSAPGEPVAAEGVDVSPLEDREGPLDVLRVEAAQAAYMLVYHDAPSRGIALDRAACLGTQLTMLQRELGDTREGAQWDSVVFTADPAYTPPRGNDVTTRWLVQTGSQDEQDGGPSGVRFKADPQAMILATMPHEQVHEYQTHAGARLPRWFAEGHASWVGLRVTARLDPDRAAARRAQVLAELTDATGPLDLANWGSVRPKREAIMRQVSPEDRARMEADPGDTPAGTFQFSMDDLEGDESNMPARYAAALMVFEGLEQRHGADAVRDWANDLILPGERVTSAMMASAVERHFGEDLDTLLAEPVHLASE